jgi:hypothetical protein
MRVILLGVAGQEGHQVGGFESRLQLEPAGSSDADVPATMVLIGGRDEQDAKFRVAAGQRPAHVEAVALGPANVEEYGLGDEALDGPPIRRSRCRLRPPP